MKSFVKSFGFAVALAVTALGGCKQGVEERCQVDSDCDGALICSQSTKLCVGEGAGTDGDIDAGVVTDAADDAAIDATQVPVP